jgi:hypothetical protein
MSKYERFKRLPSNYGSESRTVDIKKSEGSRNKVQAREDIRHSKNFRVVETRERQHLFRTAEKGRERFRGGREETGEGIRTTMVKDNNRLIKQKWSNKVKRSVTEGDGWRDGWVVATSMEIGSNYKK